MRTGKGLSEEDWKAAEKYAEYLDYQREYNRHRRSGRREKNKKKHDT
jgi:hypothetical protein